MKLTNAGFTLIELMIAVAVVALLTAVALPAFQEQIARGKRAEGKAALLKAMQLQERNYTANGTYVMTTGLPRLYGLAGAPTLYSGDDPTNASGWYVITADSSGCTSPDLRVCITVVATPRAGYTDPNCGVLGLNSAGVQTETGTKDLAYCWKR